MTDNDLLELAAKVAGVDIETDEWNPLTDDGDALRLAVKLRFSVCVEHDQTWIAYLGYTTNPVCFEYNFSDPCAATRRAIVRAAVMMYRAKESFGAYKKASEAVTMYKESFEI